VASVAPAARPTAWRAWWWAARPRTLPLAAAPVLVGTAVAHAEGGARALPALAALAGALALQVGANLANDVFDAERGADTHERTGPARAVQSGWLRAADVRRGALAAFGAAAAVGLYLVAVGGWPIAILGAASIAAGLAYTGGPWPLAYHGLGEVAVLLFFGCAAVCGTTWVQSGALPTAAWIASLPVGLLATAVLAVNNARDARTDAGAGKRTLAVRLGARAARREIAALVAGAFAVPVAWALARGAPALLLPLLALPSAWRCLAAAARAEGAAWNAVLSGTAQLTFGFATLLAAGIALAP